MAVLATRQWSMGGQFHVFWPFALASKWIYNGINNGLKGYKERQYSSVKLNVFWLLVEGGPLNCKEESFFRVI